jgi:hypothetical protein
VTTSQASEPGPASAAPPLQSLSDEQAQTPLRQVLWVGLPALQSLAVVQLGVQAAWSAGFGENALQLSPVGQVVPSAAALQSGKQAPSPALSMARQTASPGQAPEKPPQLALQMPKGLVPPSGREPMPRQNSKLVGSQALLPPVITEPPSGRELHG